MNPLGDLSIPLEPSRFTPGEIATCIDRTGLLEMELVLPSAGSCSCASCIRSGVNREMDFSEVRQLLDDVKSLGCRRVSLLEPSLSTFREPAIEACVEREMAVEAYFPSSVIDARLANTLAEAAATAAFPLYSRDGDVHDRLIGQAGSFAAIDRSIQHLTQSGYASLDGPAIAIRIYLCEANLEEVPELFRWVRSRGFVPRVQAITPRTLPAASSTVVSSLRARAVFEELATIDQKEFGNHWPLEPALIGRSGGRHAYSCFVAACGTVYASEGIAIPIGNVREEPLREILNLSEVLEDLRAASTKIKEPSRTRLQHYGCYGSRETAYQLTGDYLAGDAWCWMADGAAIQSLPAPAAGMVPHGAGIRMVDELTEIGERIAFSRLVVPKDSFFVDADGRLDELTCIEMIAQSFAASHGFHPDAGESTIQRGLLIGVKDVNIVGDAFAGDTLRITVRKTTRFGDFGVIDGEVHHADGRLVATGQIKVWRPTGEAAKALIP